MKLFDASKQGYEDGFKDAKAKKPKNFNRHIGKIKALLSQKYVSTYIDGYCSGYSVGKNVN